MIDFYIKMKEDTGDRAVASSLTKISQSDQLYTRQFAFLASLLDQHTAFYRIPENTRDETRQKIDFFKDVIENKGGHHIFYINGKPIRDEMDVHILFRLVWLGTPSERQSRGERRTWPADFKISRGSADKTIVEFKLARNTQLKRNLEKQTEIYQRASDARTGFKVIIYFTKDEQRRVEGILRQLRMIDDPNIILVDARDNNKPSASKAS